MDGSATHPLPEGARRELLGRLSRAVAGVPGVRLALAFGSFARGEPFRDIDVGVLLDEPFSWRVPGRVADDVVAVVGPTPAPVDLVPLNDAPPAFRLAAAEGGLVLFEREPREAIEFFVRARSEVLDLREWRRSHGLAG